MALNRPTSNRAATMEFPPIGTGTNYGTVMGQGAGGARFFGEGTVFLKRGGGPRSLPPFTFAIANNQAYMVNAGMVNNVPVTSAATGWTENGFVYIEADANGGAIATAECKIGADPGFAQTPEEDSPPAVLFIPVYRMVTVGNIKTLKRVLGNHNVTAIPSPVQWEYQEPGNCGSVARVWYAWSVFS